MSSCDEVFDHVLHGRLDLSFYVAAPPAAVPESAHRRVHLRNVFGKVGVSSRRQLRDKSLDPFLPPDSNSERREH
jgi:hypothetical protein